MYVNTNNPFALSVKMSVVILLSSNCTQQSYVGMLPILWPLSSITVNLLQVEKSIFLTSVPGPVTLPTIGYACSSTKFQINPLCVSNREVNTKNITLFLAVSRIFCSRNVAPFLLLCEVFFNITPFL